MYDDKMVEMERAVFLLDLLLTVLAFLGAFWLYMLILPDVEVSFYSHVFLLPLILFFIVGFFSYFGAYEPPRGKTTFGYSWAIFRGITLTIGAILALIFFLKIEYVSRLVILIFSGFEFLIILSTRWWLRSYYIRNVKEGSKALHVLVIGTGERAAELSVKLTRQAEWGMKIIGHLDPDGSRVGRQVNGAPVIGTIDNISQILKEHVVDEVIIAIPRSLLEDVEPIALACEEEGIKLQFMADIFNLQHVARIRLTQVGEIPLLTLEPVAQDEIKLLFKRCFDFFVTLLSMPIVLPIVGIIAIAVKWDSPGPIFFIQQRVGLKKRLFPMIKFRSMFIDAEERLKEIEHLNEAEGPIFKMKNDPRVTRVGNFIRKTSLDEIPQLFNVLMGHMSLVGPRPMSIRDVDLFDKGVQRKRFSVKPGITCIWQVSGRSNLPFEKWLELDLEYIENWNLWLDLKILLKTVPAVLFSKGAV
ncbi:UDP-phosphate galactose phosphotransferase [Desulfosarcina ovata subsp. sediminis]|uniref:UDP-phosphate galactose phosphotransferase n=1 Tax=Desulfosarcina ovata subsp. sediminis TaxID=885957 RepID=A0A5K7ZGJ6_9BACT|nr:sugar transferase [Desulfosarcina ovata]BBO81318.1 UDP-phosphate galactose phosphotransferase [Desulfosarcina ovata subsp. sediminis]